jgi:hypothetical protein
MARRIEFEVVVDSDGAVTALKQIGETADEAGEQIEEMGDEGAKASRGLSASLSGLKGAFGAVAAGAAAAAAAVAAVGTAVINMAATNDEIAKMAATLGTTAEELQIVTGALGLGGVGAEQAAQAIRDLNLRLGDAELRGGAAGEALDRLGLSAQQLEALPLAERFALIADRLQGIESQSLRARTAADLMGEAGVRLLSAFQDGGEGIRRAAGAIERAGIVSNEAAAESEALTDQVSLLRASLGRLMADALEPLVAPMTTFIEQINDSVHAYRRLKGLIPEVVTEQDREVEAIEELSRQLAEAESHLRGYSAAQQVLLQTPGLEEEAERNQEALESMAERVADLNRRLQEARGTFRAAAATTEQATEAIEQMASATDGETSSVEELNQALKETIKLKIDLADKTEGLQHKSADEAAAIVAAADAQRAAADKRVTSMQQLAGMQEATNQQILSSSVQIIGLIQRAEEDALAQRMQQEEAAADRVRSIREQLARATTERTRERLREELDAAIGSQRIAEEQARQAFARTKALALGQAVISTAQAVASALAVPPAPNVPLAIAAGALGGAQIAAIASEPAPSFHSGGLLRDEMMIRARQGEAILSPAAVRAAGGEEGVRALNQGRPTGPTTLVVEQKLRTRVLDAQVYDLGRSGRGSLQNQIHRGQPRPGSHRPTGMG